MASTAYPVSYEIERPERYQRLTVLFRLILAIPQLLLVGGGGFELFNFSFRDHGAMNRVFVPLFTDGILTGVLAALIFLSWVAILFTTRFPAAFQGFCLTLFRWSQNVQAYLSLLADPYPPFGDGPYPLDLQVAPTEVHNRWTVAFRPVLATPHLLVLAVLHLAQSIVTIIAWFAILFTGRYPAAMYDFSVGVSRWTARVYAYLCLFVDDYPPFTLAAQPGIGGLQPQPA